MEILEGTRTDLTCAVLLIDDLTGMPPIGRMKVEMSEPEFKGILNRSGYYLFLNLNDKLLDVNSMIIVSDNNGNKYYQDRLLSLSKIEIAVNYPVIEVELLPATSYPFPTGTTLVRGIVLMDAIEAGKTIRVPVSGAKVEIKERGLVYVTNGRGDFVFYFKNLKSEDIVHEGQKKFIRMGSDTTFKLSVSCKGYKPYESSGHKAEFQTTTVINAVLEAEPV